MLYYTDADTQQRVEKYFSNTKPSVLLYWMGIKRAALTVPYRMLDLANSPAARMADGSGMYAHWAWDQDKVSGTSGSDCVTAWSK